jgi:hypothetical protein
MGFGPSCLCVLATLCLIHDSFIVSNETKKIFNDGYLGSHTDEERSEMRYAMRIAELRESSDL